MISEIQDTPLGVSSATHTEDFFVEWSDSQKAFHVIPPNSAFRANLDAWFAGRPCDFRVLGRFNSHEAAHAFVATLDKSRGSKNQPDDASAL